MRKYPEHKKYKPLNPSKYVGNINEIIMRSSWESKLAFFFRHPTICIKMGV